MVKNTHPKWMPKGKSSEEGWWERQELWAAFGRLELALEGPADLKILEEFVREQKEILEGRRPKNHIGIYAYREEEAR